MCFKNTSGDSFSCEALDYSELSLESEHVILSYASFTSDKYNEIVEKLGCRGDYYDVTFHISYCSWNTEQPDVLKCGLIPLYAQNLTEDELEVSVAGCQVEYPHRKTVLTTYKDASTEILEVDPLRLSGFRGKVSKILLMILV